MTAIFIAALSTLLLSLGLTRFMMYARMADVPNERSSHTVVTPKGGGVAIIISMFFFLCYVHFFVVPVLTYYTLLLLLLTGLMGFVGVMDDIYHLSYLPRLCVQVLIAVFLVASGFSIDHIPLPGIDEIELGPFGLIITILWVVGFINAFNFMDGLHGLAAGGALVVSVIALLFMPALNPFYFVFYGLIFSLLGYLRYNFHYGRIFMSDVGSQFLGSLFAVTTLMIEAETDGEFRFYIIPLLFLPFIYDAGLTFIMRLVRGKNVFQPHREFLFHRLVHLGWSHTWVALFYMGLIMGQGVVVFFFLQGHQANATSSEEDAQKIMSSRCILHSFNRLLSDPQTAHHFRPELPQLVNHICKHVETAAAEFNRPIDEKIKKVCPK